ncbi:hypothetical protein APS_0835 [Acetobacter pasteurianus subsp. pasteurianus LMG 1262 = NBRC 106471]|nr:hypothetical protein APS_0835 [Acetobacter pasteurianus subsp. pasteurianus LMG 1262 = NBRC 106471]
MLPACCGVKLRNTKRPLVVLPPRPFLCLMHSTVFYKQVRSAV